LGQAAVAATFFSGPGYTDMICSFGKKFSGFPTSHILGERQVSNFAQTCFNAFNILNLENPWLLHPRRRISPTTGQFAVL